MSQQILKLSEIIEITGLSRSSIYRLAKNNQFPKPIKLGERSSGWVRSEFDLWLNERIEISRHDQEV